MTGYKKKGKAPQRDVSAMEYDEMLDNGNEGRLQSDDDTASNSHSATDNAGKVPSIRKQHLHNIMSYWRLEAIKDFLPMDFRNLTNKNFECSTLHLLFEIAKHKPGIDGCQLAGAMIASKWNVRSPYSQDHPTGHNDPRAREAYLREDLEAILHELKNDVISKLECAGQAAANSEVVGRTVETPTTNAPTAPAHNLKRTSENAEPRKNAKRQRSTSPTRNDSGTGLCGFQRTELLDMIDKLWGMSALHIVPDKMRDEFPSAKKKPATWSMDALQGLYNIMVQNNGLRQPSHPNKLRVILGEAYRARIKRPGETRDFNAKDTANVIKWMQGDNFIFNETAPCPGFQTDLQVFNTASPAPGSEIVNNPSTTGVVPGAGDNSGHATSAAQNHEISSSSRDSEADGTQEVERRSSSNHGHTPSKDTSHDATGNTSARNPVLQDYVPQEARPQEAPRDAPRQDAPQDGPRQDAPRQDAPRQIAPQGAPQGAPQREAPRASNGGIRHDGGSGPASAPSATRVVSTQPSPNGRRGGGGPAMQPGDANEALRLAQRRVSEACHFLDEQESELAYQQALLNEFELRPRELNTESRIAGYNVQIKKTNRERARAETEFGKAKFELATLMIQKRK